jgi:hypothetical protein
MNASLLSQCKNSSSQEEGFFHEVCLRYAEGFPPTNEETDLLLKELLLQQPGSFSEYGLFLKKTLCWVFLSREKQPFATSSVRLLLLKICEGGFSQKFPYVQALQDLIFFMLKKPFEFLPPKILSKGGVLMESPLCEKEGLLPDLERGAQLSLLWFLFGQMSGREEWKRAALSNAFWSLKLLGANSFPFSSLWKEEMLYKESDLLFSLFLMFDIIGSCFQIPSMLLAAKQLLEKPDHFQGELSHPFFYLVLSKEGERWKEQKVRDFSEQEKRETIWFDPDLNLVCYQGNLLKSAVSLSGNRSTLGVLHAGDLQIRSFGPQIFPIGDSSRFGMVRFPYAKSSLGDLEWKKKNNAYSLRGWVPLTQSQDESSPWMEVKHSMEKEKFLLEINLQGEIKEKLAFVFYVESKNACVEGQLELTKGSLQRYEGAIRKVFFRGKEATLAIGSQNLSCMHLIPLGGGKGYWGSNFLLAYELPLRPTGFAFCIERS